MLKPPALGDRRPSCLFSYLNETDIISHHGLNNVNFVLATTLLLEFLGNDHHCQLPGCKHVDNFTEKILSLSGRGVYRSNAKLENFFFVKEGDDN